MRMTPGTVFLVGAGPGDPGLITVRGLDLIRRADVLIFDQLGAPAFLSSTRPECEMIDVGKRSGRHTVPQEEINALLVTKAREGKMVVRLKGGDPMMFGRGGEELETLKAEGISFEVVPGVSSAIAGPSYAGVPVTHRDCTTAMAVVTGHESPSKDDSTIPWASLGGIGTVVFLMGVKNLPSISRKLIEAGKAPSTPVAIIEQATTARQRTVIDTLEGIAARAAAEKVQPPALIVVGDVVRYQSTLSWFHQRPLFGKTVVVTGTRDQARELSQRLSEAGAGVIEFPTVRLSPIRPNPGFDTFFAGLGAVRDLVFTSSNSVEEFAAALWERGADLRLLQGKGLVCIGAATANGLIRRGIRPDFTPETALAESLMPWFAGRPPAGVAILRSEKANPVLPRALESLGYHPTIVPLYRSEEEPMANTEPLERLAGAKIDAVLFSGSSSVERFAARLSGHGLRPDGFPAIVVGPITEEAARTKGFPILGQASLHTRDGLCQETLARLTNKK